MPENTLPPLTRAPIQAISMQFTLQAPFAPIHTQTYTTFYYNYSVHYICSVPASLFIILITPTQQIYQILHFY